MTDKTVSLPEGPRHAGFIRNNLRNYSMLLSLFAIMLFFQFMTDGTLLQPLNLTNLVLQNSYIVIMALGMLLVIVTGHIDLSVGSVAGFVGEFSGAEATQEKIMRAIMRNNRNDKAIKNGTREDEMLTGGIQA